MRGSAEGLWLLQDKATGVSDICGLPSLLHGLAQAALTPTLPPSRAAWLTPPHPPLPKRRLRSRLHGRMHTTCLRSYTQLPVGRYTEHLFQEQHSCLGGRVCVCACVCVVVVVVVGKGRVLSCMPVLSHVSLLLLPLLLREEVDINAPVIWMRKLRPREAKGPA